MREAFSIGKDTIFPDTEYFTQAASHDRKINRIYHEHSEW